LPQARRAVGPGRVNLIGDHTDYNRGLALPMAVGLGVTVTFAPTDDPTLVATSSSFDDRAVFPLGTDPALLEPPWARLVAAVATVARIGTGGTLAIESTLPVGSGLSSSAALAVAVATAFGVRGTPETMARLCQEAEHRIGVPVGLMDPLVCAGGRAGHAMLIDFDAVDGGGGGVGGVGVGGVGGVGGGGGGVGGGGGGGDGVATWHIPLPEEAEFVVVDSGQRRELSTSAYADRVAECRAAADVVGPLGRIRLDDLAALPDPVLRRRARHVVTECARVRDTVTALAADDLDGAGALLTAGHRSLADDFAVSTPVVDELVVALTSRHGVFGARMTGAGFGGCVVALTRPGAVDTSAWPTPAWRVRASDGTLAHPTS
jgi:galactokinase